MTDVMLLWETPLLFEKLFVEYGIKCQRVPAESISTPFLPPCRCLILPTGFANPAYTSTLKSVARNKNKIENFLQKGGAVVIFGPMVPEHGYDWLPFELKYVQEQGYGTVQRVAGYEDLCVIDKHATEVEYDGYFLNTDAKVVLKDANNRPLMIIKDVGKGKVIACSIHEFPSKDFLQCIVEMSSSCKI
ncbi:hypothetical protein [Methanomethylovorans sp.]|uniref:hypothetical protein n=1 Tax=Methanomethylovorans sp. TaxID=2758717 RepID=UPI00351BF989